MDHMGGYFLALAIGSVAAFVLIVGYVSIEDRLLGQRNRRDR